MEEQAKDDPKVSEQWETEKHEDRHNRDDHLRSYEYSDPDPLTVNQSIEDPGETEEWEGGK